MNFNQEKHAPAIAVHGSKFVKALMDSGIMPNNCRRMIIDIEAGGVIKAFYETFPDERIESEPVLAAVLDLGLEVKTSLYGSTGIDSIDGISTRAYNCLTAAGIVETSQVNSMTDKELLRLKNMGRRSVQNIREAIALASAGAK